jgi:hypothetical protein
MRAIIVDPPALEGLRLAEVPEPVAGPSQVVLEVTHIAEPWGSQRRPLRPGAAGRGAWELVQLQY